jgi:glycosyltransferase involved in cell wall biosynthesis
MFIEGKQVHIGWYGVGSLASGYGASNLAILKALAASSVVVHDPGDDSCEVGVAYMPLDCNPLELLKHPVKILYAMFEATRWPDAWVSATNCANQIWVPSKWCKETLRASGCDRPIRVIPLGFDPEVYYPAKPAKRPKPDPFVIGYAGACVGRKGFDLLIEAFQQEFVAGENVELVIRSASYLTSHIPSHDHIRVIEGALTLAEMRDFYRACDLVVLPSRGEGFGLTALEAMACGTCVAVTDFGGSRQYIGDDTLKIAAGIEPCPDYRDCNGYWAKPSMQSLRYCLRWAFENRAQAKDMGLASAKRVCETLTYKHTAQAIEVALCQVDATERIALASQRVVAWRGNPMNVQTRAGRFTRGVPRVLSDAQIALLNPSDIGPQGFWIAYRYIRSAPTADTEEAT